MNNLECCERCREPTKHPVGCWDGPGGGGFVYDCESWVCPIKAESRKQAAIEQHRRERAKAANAETGADPQSLKELRLKKGIPLPKLANIFGISLTKMSDYQIERDPIPKDTYDRMISWLESLPDEE